MRRWVCLSCGRLVLTGGLVLACHGLSIARAHANGFRNPPEGAAALARDGGKIAHIRDASAVTHNPANLAEIDHATALFSMSFIRSEAKFTSPSGGSATTEDPEKYLPNVQAAWPVADGQLVLGLGVTTPFGQSTTWSDDSPFRYAAPYFAELRVVNVNPTAAARVGETVSVGFGADIFWSKIDLRQFFPWSMVLLAPVPDGRVKLEGDGIGIGANVGVTWRFAENQRLALTYRTSVSVDYEGDTEISNVPPPLGTVVARRSDFDTKVEFPAILAVGYGVQLTDTVQVGADVEWVQFSLFEKLPLDLGANNAAGLFPPSFEQAWQDTWNAGVGAGWQVSEQVVVRAGYKFLESPIPDATHAPSLPDADRHLFTAGLGYARANHQLDLAYALSLFEDRNVTRSPVPVFNGDYDLTSHIVQVSYGYSF